MHHVKVLIVGAGAAGMAAALAAEESLHTHFPEEHPQDAILLVEREKTPGGVLRQCIHSGFGQGYFSKDMTGVEYMNAFTARLKKSQISIWCDTSVLEISNNKTALLSGPEIGCIKLSFDQLILATGCYERPFASLATAGTRPAGIFTAGEAQRLINICHKNIGEQIIILGSGDMGQILARRMTLQKKNVLAVIEQRNTCGGNKKNQQDCLKAYHIPVLLSSTIVLIHGTGRICGITVRNTKTGEETYIGCDTLISAIGLIPERKLIRHLTTDGMFPDWITLCGNCEHVHTIVDNVTLQGEQAGITAVQKLICT